MSTATYLFLEPLDVLLLRGNKLFGDPGSVGESLIPPWPSVVAGALRSRILADSGVDLAAFASGEQRHPTLGTPREPGNFAIKAFQVARRRGDGLVEALVPPPADLFIGQDNSNNIEVRVLAPQPRPTDRCLASSYPLPMLPILASKHRTKPLGGHWLTETGWRRYLQGQPPAPDDLVRTDDLWALDPRVGVGLDAPTRRASDGRLFTVHAIAMIKRHHKRRREVDVGFLVGASGAQLPNSGTLRLGGDGRAAAVHALGGFVPPEPDYRRIAADRRCRLVLTTPGLFGRPGREETDAVAGWLPNGIARAADGSLRFDLHDVRGTLVSAAVGRATVVSGWDLAASTPKSAQRAAPSGSVYCLEDLDATPDTLRKLAGRGLWSESCEDAQRRAEGFNLLSIAAWPQP